MAHRAALGHIVKCLHNSHDEPQTLILPDIPPGGFEKKQYSMYLNAEVKSWCPLWKHLRGELTLLLQISGSSAKFNWFLYSNKCFRSSNGRKYVKSKAVLSMKNKRRFQQILLWKDWIPLLIGVWPAGAAVTSAAPAWTVRTLYFYCWSSCSLFSSSSIRCLMEPWILLWAFSHLMTDASVLIYEVGTRRLAGFRQ